MRDPRWGNQTSNTSFNQSCVRLVSTLQSVYGTETDVDYIRSILSDRDTDSFLLAVLDWQAVIIADTKCAWGYHVNLLVVVVFVLLHVVCSNDNFTSNYSAQGREREGSRWRKSSRKKLNIQSVPKLDWEATFIIAAAVSVVWYSTLHEGARNRDWVRIQPYGGCRFGVVTYLVTCMLLRIQLQLNYGHRCLKTRAALLNPKFALLTLPVPGPVRGKNGRKSRYRYPEDCFVFSDVTSHGGCL